MTRIRQNGGRGRDTWRPRLRQRRLLLIAVTATLVAAGSVAIPAAADDDDFGKAQVEMWSGWEYEIEYGQPLDIQGALSDESQSCLTAPGICDTPEGDLAFSGVNHTIDYGGAHLQKAFDDPGANYATFEGHIPAEKFDPGIRYVVIDYAGNFDEFYWYVKVTVRKQACHSFQVYPDRYGSKPGEPVTLTADLGSAGHTGTVTIFDSQGALASGTVTDGRSFSTSTSALPQGTTSFYATYSGDGNYEGCTSGYGNHLVSPDANPTARPDTASTTVGSQVGINVLVNDEDDNPGIRPEVTNNPDFGDFEKIGNTYWYTPDPDMGNYQDGFDYIVYDSIGQSSAEAHVVINVGCTPYAGDDRYGTRAYTPLNVSTASGLGVRRNDETCDQTVSLASSTTHGTLDLQPDGSFSYVPEAGWTGTDAFTYQYTDLLETPVTGRAEIKVTPLEANPSPLPPLEGTTTTTTEAPTSTTTEDPSSSTSTSTSTSTTSTTPATTTTTTPRTTGQVTLASLYQMLLGRTPDPSGGAYWAPLLDGGTATEGIARALIDSAEFRRRLVDTTYTRVLGRRPDAAGSAYWTTRLDHDIPNSLRTGLLGSNEMWNRVGAEPAEWTDRAYQALLGRDPTPAEHQVIDPAIAAGADRTSVAARITRLDGAYRFLAELWYTSLLDRSATTAEADAWASAMAAGRSERSLVAQLAAAEAASN